MVEEEKSVQKENLVNLIKPIVIKKIECFFNKDLPRKKEREEHQARKAYQAFRENQDCLAIKD